MAEKVRTLEYYDEGRGKAVLWFGLLSGPAAWFLHLNVSYGLVLYVCLSGAIWLLHLASVATLGLAAVGMWVAWGSWTSLGRPEVTQGEGTLGRSRFMALSGVALNGFFAVIILLGWIPSFLLDPCSGSL